MSRGSLRLGVVILAAGAGRRFGGGKLLALLDDRPLVQHVVDAAADWGPAAIIAVLGRDADVAERIMDWGCAVRVANPDPDRGLASRSRWAWRRRPRWSRRSTGCSSRWGPAARPDDDVRGARPGRLGGRRCPPDRGAALLGGGGGRRQPGAAAARGVAADRRADRRSRMGPVIAAHPELVLPVPIDGANPDVDTPDDLRRL